MADGDERRERPPPEGAAPGRLATIRCNGPLMKCTFGQRCLRSGARIGGGREPYAVESLSVRVRSGLLKAVRVLVPGERDRGTACIEPGVSEGSA